MSNQLSREGAGEREQRRVNRAEGVAVFVPVLRHFWELYRWWEQGEEQRKKRLRLKLNATTMMMMRMMMRMFLLLLLLALSASCCLCVNVYVCVCLCMCELTMRQPAKRSVALTFAPAT